MTKQLDYHTIYEIFRRFREAEAEPKGELEHVNAYTLLVAVALSAQATDAGVNKATRKLFETVDTPEKMLALGEEGLTEHIKSIGLYRQKAKNVIKLSQILHNQYDDQVPSSRAALQSLPGVGHKTANVVLNWATGRTESHNLDAKLSTITVRSADGFSYNLDVSQIIHIPRNDAPRVIARFGSMEALVTQVLEPTIGNYFRNTAQGSDVIDFLTKRTERQKEAKESIARALGEYNVGAVETLIGDINPPAELMKPLTERKVAVWRATACSAA